MPDGAAPSISPAGAGPHRNEDTPPLETPKSGPIEFLKRLFGSSSESGLNGILQQSDANGTELSPAERLMMERIIAFDQKRVDDVGTPRTDIVGVHVEESLTGLLKCFSEANHSRLPVYRGDLDDPIGMVHIKDVVGLLADPEAAPQNGNRPILEGLIRKVLYVPPSMPVTDLLLRMQASRIHMALVIDEFGGTDGLVTIEDLIELIVGDIRDEHDTEEDDFILKQLADDRWEAHARIPLEDLSAGTGFNFEVEELEADTVGGLVFSLAGRVPLRGEVISHPKGPQFEICDADARRIRRVIIRLQETLPETLIDNEMASDDGPETVTSPEGRQVNRQGLKKGSRDRATPEQNIDNAGPQG